MVMVLIAALAVKWAEFGVSPLSNVQLLRLVHSKPFWVSPAQGPCCKHRCRLVTSRKYKRASLISKHMETSPAEHTKGQA